MPDEIRIDTTLLVDACPLPEPHRSRWLDWLLTHCAACGNVINRTASLDTACQNGACTKLIIQASYDNVLELLGVAWRHNQGPNGCIQTPGYDQIRAFLGEFMHWYEPDCSITGLDELDTALLAHLQALLDIGG